MFFGCQIQSKLFDSAYEIAEDGQQLIQQGKHEAAAVMLSRYMSQVVDTMHRTLAALLDVKKADAI